jgi:starvation-inducible DNA-binding protein
VVTTDVQALQQVLVNLIALQLQGKQAQWTAVGPGSLGLRRYLDEVVEDTRRLGDAVAERIRALGGVPDGRAPTVVAGAGLGPFPLGEQTTAVVAGLLAERLRTVAGAIHDEPGLPHTVVEALEKHAWLLDAEARA